MNEQILFVDDDDNVLAAFRRQLKNEFIIHTANSGAQGLTLVNQQAPYAVIIADMRMPGMNGVEFLSLVRKMTPDSVRMMLTGNADQNTAIEAINKGNIFRFLTKPIQREDLIEAINAGLKQYDLITSEHVLLEKTLTGSIHILTEILSMVNPVAFSRAIRVRSIVRQISAHLVEQNRLDNTYQVELAAMLSHIGCVTVPPEVLDKINHGKSLTVEERNMYSKHPLIGSKLIASIPRLEAVAQMILDQQKPYNDYKHMGSSPSQSIALGSQVLKIALDYDFHMEAGLKHEAIMNIFKNRVTEYNPELINVLLNIPLDTGEFVVRSVNLSDIQAGYILNKDILSITNTLLMTHGTKITPLALERLKNFYKSVGIIEPISVRIPTRSEDQP